MGRPPRPIGRMPFRDVWTTIERRHNIEWKIRLRPAANIIGFNLFPVGWRWTEFTPLTPDDSTDYEAVALELSSCGLPLPASRSPTAAIDAGRSYRREKTTECLARILARSEVRAYHGRQKNIAAPVYGSHLPDRPPNSTDYERISVEHSTIGSLVSRQYETWVDAPQLIGHLLNGLETRGAPQKHDRLRIERWCRNVFESGDVPVTQGSRAELTARCLDWLATTSGDADQIAGEAQVRPIISQLLVEYASAQ